MSSRWVLVSGSTGQKVTQRKKNSTKKEVSVWGKSSGAGLWWRDVLQRRKWAGERRCQTGSSAVRSPATSWGPQPDLGVKVVRVGEKILPRDGTEQFDWLLAVGLFTWQRSIFIAMRTLSSWVKPRPASGGGKRPHRRRTLGSCFLTASWCFNTDFLSTTKFWPNLVISVAAPLKNADRCSTLPPHGFAWYCNILSLIYNWTRNTAVMNYGYKQKAASLSVCRFSDVLTSRGSRGVSRTGRVPSGTTHNQRLHIRQSVQAWSVLDFKLLLPNLCLSHRSVFADGANPFVRKHNLCKMKQTGANLKEQSTF